MSYGIFADIVVLMHLTFVIVINVALYGAIVYQRGWKLTKKIYEG